MGTDKARLTIDGARLRERQMRLLKSLAPDRLFLAGPPLGGAEEHNFKVVADTAPDCGPLAGLVAALRVCQSPLLLALAVDLPRMTDAFLRGLIERCALRHGLVPFTDRLEPLAAIYPIATLALAEEQLASREYSLGSFVDRCVAAGLMEREPISPADLPLFLNLNTPTDLEQLR